MAFNPLQNTWWNQNPRQRAIPDESTKFPWITKSDEARILNIARNQAHSSYEENLIVNDLYKKALKNQNSINFSNNRQDAKQELYKQSLDTKDKNQSNQLKSTERTAEVADMIRDYARNNWYWAELEWWDDTKVIEWFTKSNVMAKNEIQDYINWDESSFSFSKRMWFWAWSERSRFDMITEDKWEWNDDILWHFETESLEDAKWNKVWTWFKNLWKSAYNLASDLTNMVMNPIDTVNNLSKAAVWGAMNLFGSDDYIGNMKDWKFKDWFESANEVADGMWDFLKNRYGWVDQIANSLYQDPVWVISDIASVVTWWAGLVKWGATAAAKTAAKVWAKSTAKTAGKIANVADDVMKAWIKYDPATQIMNAEWKVLKWTYNWAKATVNTVAHPIESIKWAYKTVAEWLNKVSDWGAEKITKTATAQDKLYKAQEPRMNILTRNKDLQKRRINSDRANQLIVENGYKPTDTNSRLLAHEATMKKIWGEVEKKINWWEAVQVDQSRLAEVLHDYITEQKKLWSSFNEADLTALEKELKTLEGNSVDLPTLEKKKQLYNSIINNRWEQKVSDVFANWIKKLTHEIWVIEDEILAEIPWDFQKLKNDFWALADTYEDVFKADMKNQRKKWLWLTETYSRIEWAWDMLNGALSIFNGWAKDIIKWAGKVLIWKSLAKAKDVDFLVKQWFDELSNGYTSKASNIDNPVTTKTNPAWTIEERIPRDEIRMTEKEIKPYEIPENRVNKWLKEVWKSEEFWPSYEGLKGNDAIQFLKENRDGEVLWAYEHEWKPIDLVWWKTNAETNGDWFWLSKIEEKHPWMLDRIDELMTKTKWIEDDNWILIYDNWKERAIVMPHYKWKEKRWLLTAYKLTKKFKRK